MAKRGTPPQRARSGSDPGRRRPRDVPEGEHLHFLGIAGHTMRGLALTARQLGYTVTGTDESAYPPGSDWLTKRRFRWWRLPAAAHLKGVTEVIISGHISADHPELLAARRQGIPVRSFAEFVGRQTKLARTIVVAGTHGKTTTTSLLAWIFECAGRQPDYLVGIQPHNFESSVRLTGSPVAIIEGDEYRASQPDRQSKFAYYHPAVLVITAIEMDHPDFFKSYGEITKRFAALIDQLPADGRLLYHHHVDPQVIKRFAARELYEGRSAQAGWHTGKRVQCGPEGLRFSMMSGAKKRYGTVELPLYGEHNASNAVAAVGVALGEGIDFETVQRACRTFGGAARRFQRVSAKGAAVAVFDDYAHHPTEVAATLAAARAHFAPRRGRSSGRRVLAMFRPHTYSRTKKLLNDYRTAFDNADLAWVAEIEGARERQLAKTVSAADLAAVTRGRATAIEDRAELLAAMVASAAPGDTILCMSVNGYEGFAEELAKRLEKKFG